MQSVVFDFVFCGKEVGSVHHVASPNRRERGGRGAGGERGEGRGEGAKEEILLVSMCFNNPHKNISGRTCGQQIPH